MTITVLNEVIPDAFTTANGTQKVFSVAWNVVLSSEVEITIDDDVTEIPFTVSNLNRSDSGLIVTFDEPPPENSIVRIRSVIPYSRQNQFGQELAFRAPAVNADISRVVQMVQQVNRETLRSLRIPNDEDAANFSSILPGYVAGGLLRYSPTSKRVETLTAEAFLAEVNAASVNRAGVYYAEDIDGLPTDGTTDASVVLSRFFDAIHKTGGGLVILYNAAGFYVRYRVRVPSFVRVVFLSGIDAHAEGGIFLNGEIAETPAVNKFRLLADAASGQRVLQVDTNPQGGGAVSEFFSAGDRLILRGENDAAGNSIERELGVIDTLDDANNEIVLTEDLEFSYLVTYGKNAYAENFGLTADRTTISIQVSAKLASDVLEGEFTLPIVPADAGRLAVGDYVIITDDSKSATDNIYRSEVNRVLDIDRGGVNTVTLHRRTPREYTAANAARIVKINPIVGASVSNADITYISAPPSSLRRHAIEARYCVDVSIEYCNVLNNGFFGNRGNGIRITDSFNTWGRNCRVSDPKYTDGGEGYCYGIYTSTNSGFENSFAAGGRHNFLWQTSNHCFIRDCTSERALLADIDFHGLGEHYCGAVNLHVAGHADKATGSTQTTHFVFGNSAHGGVTKGCYVDGFTITNSRDPEAKCFRFQPGSDDCYVNNGDVTRGNVGLFHSDLSAYPNLKATNCKVTNVAFRDMIGYVVDIDGGRAGSAVRTLEGVLLRNIMTKDCPKGIVANQIAGLRIQRCDMETSTVSGAAPSVIECSDCTDLVVADFDVEGYTQGIELTDCPDFRIRKAAFSDMGDDPCAVLVDNGGNNGGIWAHSFAIGGGAIRSGATSTITLVPLEIGEEYLTT